MVVNIYNCKETLDRGITVNDNPLILHLKYKYYDMIHNGEKTVEFREAKPYWIKRIRKWNKKEIILVPGYVLDNSMDLKAKVDYIDFYCFADLPEYVKENFSKSLYDSFIAIHFKLDAGQG